MPILNIYRSVLILFAALLLDRAIGDPQGMPHPVRAVGRLVKNLERALYGTGSRVRGTIAALCAVFIVVLIINCVLRLMSPFPPLRTLAEIYLIYAAIAWRSLKDESSAVARKLLERDIDGARYALSRIVGRDTGSLGERPIIKAAVETVGENSIDAVFSPLLYIVAGFAFGCPAEAAWAFKTASTLDSMIGYKNERYLNFGRFSARLDDALNFIPARLGSAFMLMGAALNGYAPKLGAIRGIMKDRKRHASPNSAHGESVMAWLLGIELGGGGTYEGVFTPKPAIGIPSREPRISDIERSHDIMDWGVAAFLLVCTLAAAIAAGAGQ